MIKKLLLIAGLGAASAGFGSVLVGCAANTSQIRTQYVSPLQYSDYNCKQITAEFRRLSRKVSEVGAQVDETASNDDAQAAIGLILFWPALFFLEGSETAQTAEYARLKGELEALEGASITKECCIEFKREKPSEKQETSIDQET